MNMTTGNTRGIGRSRISSRIWLTVSCKVPVYPLLLPSLIGVQAKVSGAHTFAADMPGQDTQITALIISEMTVVAGVSLVSSRHSQCFSCVGQNADLPDGQSLYDATRPFRCPAKLAPVAIATLTEATSPVILMRASSLSHWSSRPTSVEMDAALPIASAQLMASARPLTSSNPSDCFTLCSLANGVMLIWVK